MRHDDAEAARARFGEAAMALDVAAAQLASAAKAGSDQVSEATVKVRAGCIYISRDVTRCGGLTAVMLQVMSAC